MLIYNNVYTCLQESKDFTNITTGEHLESLNAPLLYG